MMNLDNHPCFNKKSCKDFGRVHLPVAPACNIQCNFCNRKFDCVNESRPGVSSSLLTPDQAMAYLAEVVEAKPNTSVVGIAGPGDPFANAGKTMETLTRVRAAYPEMLLCVATNGLNIHPYLDELKAVNTTHISITINAVDPEIGAKMYSWVRDGKRSIGPAQGAKLILERQFAAVKGLKERDIMVKVNSILLPGINDEHMVDVAKKMGEMDVDIFNIMPYFPTKDSNFEDMPEPSKDQLKELRKAAQVFVPQMTHCKRCRADAVGLLDDPLNQNLMDRLTHHDTSPDPGSGTAKDSHEMPGIKDTFAFNATEPRPYVALATREGALINQHLGEATEMHIYDLNQDTPAFVETRTLPRPGGGEIRWYNFARSIKDCHTILVSGAGDAPKKKLSSMGFTIHEVNGMIDLVLMSLKKGESLNHLIVRKQASCGECRGSGTGCM
ncbi:nitrogenase cofactor biosynthesis protein NifB [uncultured Desulfobacter sp.]|uniref:nitrogenase cofactor biosynthesis protein NifB n=1 Tax=uncultured Desulfobacter sp. TaxID=240139 RepID=UPI002AAB863F|nr:nitrogenase cofactor biosynthesis protein NifB [uncultured Desulfobacter sp.]